MRLVRRKFYKDPKNKVFEKWWWCVHCTCSICEHCHEIFRCYNFDRLEKQCHTKILFKRIRLVIKYTNFDLIIYKKCYSKCSKNYLANNFIETLPDLFRAVGNQKGVLITIVMMVVVYWLKHAFKICILTAFLKFGNDTLNASDSYW